VIICGIKACTTVLVAVVEDGRIRFSVLARGVLRQQSSECDTDRRQDSAGDYRHCVATVAASLALTRNGDRPSDRVEITSVIPVAALSLVFEHG
jgi:hypothetical protein